MLSNSSIETIGALGRFGLHLGNAFQIIDDVLDYESNSAAMGKEVGDDLAEGKTTLPMIYALEHISGEEHKMLKDAIENADTSNINDIITILVRVKAFDFTRSVAENESQQAMEALNTLPESDYRSALSLLCELSLKRTS